MGPEVDSGTMDAAQLGQSLMAISGVFHHSNRALNGETQKLNVRVSKLSRGSFQIDLTFQQMRNARKLWTGSFA